jgi:hypothetical protein
MLKYSLAADLLAEGSCGMFCSNCGAEASGNFCAKCGSSLKGQPPTPDTLSPDWSGEVRYDTLIRIPEVRDLIARAAAAKQRHMSGEEFLAAADKLISLPLPLETLKTLGNVAGELSKVIGIKTEKVRSEALQVPPGKAIVATLCAFAGSGQEIRRVQQFADGCLLEATIPSDMWSFEGTLYVTIRGKGHGSHVDATTKINQLYDWGKSKRLLEGLFLALKGAV